MYSSSPSPPPCDNCCHIDNLNRSCDNLKNIYNQLSPEISNLLNLLNQLSDLLNQIKDARRNIVDTLVQSLKFPELKDSLASDILNTLGDCSWLGSFWQTIVGDALCSKITPAVLWIGWSFACVGICMLLLTPVIVWSLNLGDDGVL